MSHQMDPSFAPGALFRRTTFPHLPSQPAIVDPAVETKRKRAATGRSLLGGGIAPPPVVVEKERDVERESPKKKRSHHHRDRDEEVLDRHGYRHSHHPSQSTSHQHGISINGHSHHSRKHTRTSISPPLPTEHQSSRDHTHHSSHTHHHRSSTHHHHHHHHSSRRKRREREPSPKIHTAGMLDSFLDSHPSQQPHPSHPRSPSSSVPPRSPIGLRGRYDLDDGQDEDAGGDGELDDDPERKYCICAGPSWGEMLACDERNCRYQWFHLSCLGLDQAPQDKGKWYCTECTARRAANGRRRGDGHRKRGSVAGALL